MNPFDLALVGGGIVGLATAHRFLERHPGRRVVVLEKEPAIALHQSGRNSGVLHSGIYYKPGSLKARNCRAGKRAMEAFCQREGIAFELCGKVVVALDESELPRLETLAERGQANGVACELIGPERLRELEPSAAGIRALHVPEAGIVDYRQVCARLSELVARAGGEVRCSAEVLDLTERGDTVVLGTTRGDVEAKRVVNCAGLHCDRVMERAGTPAQARIVPFRGEYFDLVPEARSLCCNLIYPVPDPAFPFLGVHFTRRIGGGIECGPNAVLAFSREGYRKRDVRLDDLFETLRFRGFQRVASRYWRMGAGEMWRSFSKRAFVRALQRLVPEIREEHLVRVPAGVRAQAVSADGNLVDDFLIERRGRIVHVNNAPSPAATSSLAIGDTIVDRLAD